MNERPSDQAVEPDEFEKAAQVLKVLHEVMAVEALRDGCPELAAINNDAIKFVQYAVALHRANQSIDAAPADPVPTGEHWRMAISERGVVNPLVLSWIEERARELAREGK